VHSKGTSGGDSSSGGEEVNPLKRFAKKQPDCLNLTDTHTMTSHEGPLSGDWRDDANCKGKTEFMFPKSYKDITYIPYARSLCRGCDVRTECLNYALEFPAADMHGVWAGLTPRQLAAEQRRRGIRAIRPTLAQMWSGR